MDNCGRCAGHGTVQGIRFDMEDSPVVSYKERCPQCNGAGQVVFAADAIDALRALNSAIWLAFPSWAISVPETHRASEVIATYELANKPREESSDGRT